MTCSYNFDLPVDPKDLLKMVVRMIRESGGTVTGEIPDVTMSFPTTLGAVEGSCKLVSASTVNLTVTKKPEIYSCAMVRDKLVYFITEAVKLYAAEKKTGKPQAAPQVPLEGAA